MQTIAAHRIGDDFACDACGTTIRAYRYRYYPPESRSFERCIGFTWCAGCFVYTGAMVYVPRAVDLVDLLSGLPEEERERLLRSESKLIAYLAGQG